MRILTTLVAMCALFTLAACEQPEPDTYPITGEQCAPGDPVQEFGATDCIPPA